MASTSKYGGASHTPEELADPDLPVRIHRAEIGFVDRKEESSLGTSSSPSTEKPEKSDDKPKATPRKAVRTTGNRSGRQGTETDSTARSTDGDGPSNDSKPSYDDDDFFDDI